MKDSETTPAYAYSDDHPDKPSFAILSECKGPFIVNQKIGKEGTINYTLLQADGLPLFDIHLPEGKKHYVASFLEGYWKKVIAHEEVLFFLRGKFGRSIRLL